ncbi:tubulin binding cofactor C-domain-containing protein [Globomyces pollinis-pini]|nr:tubulin binding cofactor C-domain-containing protein [Globomyces pollinis-pini]
MSVSRKSTKKRYTTEEISFNNLTGLHYKPPNSFPDLIPFSIENCSNATLLVLDTLAQCTVDESKNSFIFIGCCDGPIFIRDCHDSTIITASKQLRLKNCHRLNLFIYCSSQPIIELSTEIQFSPFCFYYPELLDQFEKLKMNVFNNFWNPIYDFSDSTGKNWTIGKDKLIEYPTTPQLDILGIQLDQSSSIVPYTFGNLYQNHLNDFKKVRLMFFYQ